MLTDPYITILFFSSIVCRSFSSRLRKWEVKIWCKGQIQFISFTDVHQLHTTFSFVFPLTYSHCVGNASFRFRILLCRRIKSIKKKLALLLFPFVLVFSIIFLHADEFIYFNTLKLHNKISPFQFLSRFNSCYSHSCIKRSDIVFVLPVVVWA